MSGKKVGVIKGYMQESFLRKSYPLLDLHTFKNSNETFVALLKGEIDALVNEVPSEPEQRTL